MKLLKKNYNSFNKFYVLVKKYIIKTRVNLALFLLKLFIKSLILVNVKISYQFTKIVIIKKICSMF